MERHLPKHLNCDSFLVKPNTSPHKLRLKVGQISLINCWFFKLDTHWRNLVLSILIGNFWLNPVYLFAAVGSSRNRVKHF